MLAYVFWHRGTGDAEAYESALVAFHRVLAADPPAGFRGSAAFALDQAPWLSGGGPAYEDWYLVDDWPAVGALNAGAVSGPRRAPHDTVAVQIEAGAGGLYAARLGPATPPLAPTATWFSRPLRVPDAAWGERLASAGATEVWQRQMVLGPAPEWVAFGAEPLRWERAVVVRRRAVAP